MNLSKPVKVLIGLATAFNVISPLLGILSWLIAVFSTILGVNNYSGEPTWLFFVFFFMFFPLIFLAGITNLILIPVYLVHIIKNRQGKDNYRILVAIGLHFLPWLAMPFYFFVYIWPDNPPAWALEHPLPPIAPPQKAPVQDEPAPVETPPADELLSEAESAPLPEEPAEPGMIEATEATVITWEKPGELAAEVEADAPSSTVEPPSQPVSAPSQELKEKPARKPRRKKSQPAPEPPAEAEGSETSSIADAGTDATIISPSPVDEEPSDET